MVCVPPPPPPPPLPSQIRPGGHGGGGSPGGDGGTVTVFDCSLPLMVIEPVAEVPPPLAMGDAPAVVSPGSSTLVNWPRAFEQARRCLPASSVLMVQLST